MSPLTAMWHRLPAIFCVSLCCCLRASPLERMRTWDELSADITNEAISLVLPDGTRLRGIGRGIQADELILDVRRSSNAHLHPKGLTAIPSAQVSVVDLYLRHQSGGNRGAAIGVAVGTVALAPAAFYLGESNHEGIGGVVLIAGAAAGWYIGHHLWDRNRVDA